LLGVAPPRLESADSPQRSPVFVRAGTSLADGEPPPVPRMALPSRPPPPAAASDAAVQLAAAANQAAPGQLERTQRFLRLHPAVWMLLAPAVIAVSAVALLRAAGSHPGPKLAAPLASASAVPAQASPTRDARDARDARDGAEELRKLQARPPESLNARELAVLADAQSEAFRASAKALRSKLEANPGLAKDPAVQAELLRMADDARTSTDSLAAMAALDAPIGADLLYEVWTRTAVRSDATDLARALVYSADVRPKASPALAVALELRRAETCQQFQAIMPQALKDGDRRSAHLLAKLNAKHGCGPNKRADCYACLREHPDELKATTNAVKSRRAPDYSAP